MRLALVDGDVLIYAAGFAADGSAKKAYEAANGSLDGFNIQEHHEPVENSLQIVKQMLNGIVNAAEADDKVVYISHPVNYRESIFPEYKANRDPTAKPFWYDELKEYLLDRHGAVFSQEGDEADDAMGRAQMNALAQDRETVICSIDKDLDMIPGLHYNWGKKRAGDGVFEMSDPECLRIFYTQMLTGDRTDNIPGMYQKLGLKATDSFKAPLEVMTNAREMYDYVLKVYDKDADFLAILGQLLWIKRGDHFWVPPMEAVE